MASKNLVITISREHGTGGQQIAQEVARKLKMAYVDSQIIKSATKQLGIAPEELADFDEKVLPQLDEITELLTHRRADQHIPLSKVLVPERGVYGLPRDIIAPAATADPTDPALEHKAAIHQGYHKMVQALILDIASHGGAVILGRGSQFILKNRPHTAHVHLFAPLDYRLQRLMKLQGVSREVAERLVQENDEQQAGYVRRYYNANWRDPSHYHMVINTAHLTLASAAATIVELAKSVDHQHPEEEIHSTYERFDQDSYSLKEAADMLWVTPDMLATAALRGELKVTMIDGRPQRISRANLLDWLHKRSNTN